jgi:glycosyltransferase involved in cell wall biosynthesis
MSEDVTTLPSLTVVVPATSGRVDNLKLVFRSLARQTYKNFDVVVVNDGAHPDVRVFALFNLFDHEFTYVDQPKFERADVSVVRGEHPHMDVLKPAKNRQPRNTGALVAPSQYLVFADSDIVMHRRALECFASDLAGHPNAIVCGMYHWLPPMDATADRIFESDESFRQFLSAGFPVAPFPEGEQSHNVGPDFRSERFQKTDHTEEHGDLYAALAAYSGMLAVRKGLFLGLGGYDAWLSAGLVEDGAFGIKALLEGHKFVFDKRIQAGHVYHPRDKEYVVRQSKVEVTIMEQFYGLGEWRGDSSPFSEDGQIAWDEVTGRVKKSWADDEAAPVGR